MATAQSKPTSTGTTNTANTDMFADSKEQNAWLTLIEAYNASKDRDVARELQGAAGGVDFGPFQELLGLIGNQDYSRENAIADSQAGIQEIFRQFESTSLPQLYRNPRASGVFNDTSTQLLANDAFSSAVAKGQALQADNIMRYAQARNSQLTPVMQLLSQMVENNRAESAGLPGNIAAAQQGGRDNRSRNLALLAYLKQLYDGYNTQSPAPVSDSVGVPVSGDSGSYGAEPSYGGIYEY